MATTIRSSFSRIIGLAGITIVIRDGETVELGGIQSVRPRVGPDGRLATLAVRTLDVSRAESIPIGSVVDVAATIRKDAFGTPIDPPIVHYYGRLKVTYNHPRLERKAFGTQTLVMAPAP